MVLWRKATNHATAERLGRSAQGLPRSFRVVPNRWTPHHRHQEGAIRAVFADERHG